MNLNDQAVGTPAQNNEIADDLQETLLFDIDTPFKVTDLKQWVYCPRILYYYLCLPDVRPTTFRMEVGNEKGRDEEHREERRTLGPYKIKQGRREFRITLGSARLGLRGTADMVIWVGDPVIEVVPVDFKNSNIPGDHFKLQLMAYGILLEEAYGIPSRHGFLYEIPLRKAVEVQFTDRLRKKFFDTLSQMQTMLLREQMPGPTDQRGKCSYCEFRRFCNDVG